MNLYPDASHTDIKAAATGYDAVNYVLGGFVKCENKDVECVVGQVLKSDYQSKVLSNGFNENRLFEAKTKYYQIVDGEEVEIEIN